MADKKFAKLGAQIGDLEAAFQGRRADAEVLRNAERFASAMAMALFALEIQLKILICRRLDLQALPTEFQTHDLEGLLVLSGLSRRMEEADEKVRENWSFILGGYNNIHVNKFRYSADDSNLEHQSVEVFERLFEKPHGVLTWLAAQS
jgi:hypothetical protein